MTTYYDKNGVPYTLVAEVPYIPEAYVPPQDNYIIDGFNLIKSLLQILSEPALTSKNMNNVLTIIKNCIVKTVSKNSFVHFVMKSFYMIDIFVKYFLDIFNHESINFNLYCAEEEMNNDFECDDRFVMKLANHISEVWENVNVIIISNDNYESLSNHDHLKSSAKCYFIDVDGNEIHEHYDFNDRLTSFPHNKLKFILAAKNNWIELCVC